MPFAMQMTRKQFLRSLAGLSAGALVLGCKDGGGEPEPGIDAPPKPIDAPPQTPDASPDAPPMTTCNQTSTTIGTNHGHAVTVPGADVAAGVEKSYDIKGASGHPHTITITAAMFAMLKAGTPITVVSTNDANHTHSVTVSCA